MIIYYAVLFTGFFLIALIIRLYRSVFHNIAEHSVALVNDMLADVEEDIKIKQVQKSTNKLVLSLFKTLLLIILAFAAGSIPVVLWCLVSHEPYHSLVFTSFYAIASISLGATVPFLLPMGKRSQSGYSGPAMLLHRMALNNYTIANRLFRRETRKIRKRKLLRREDFVIVTGLARAGTTSLMNDLARIDAFVSLSYANMPFLMCPNTWTKFYKPKTGKLKERSHKDGIMIGLNSNEALEEYFFKVKAMDSYIKPDHLSEYTLPADDYSDYLDYQTIIKLDDKKIYLAKNNNFLLRYRSVRACNDKFIMVILFRDPLSHAASLLDKHREYLQLQQDDPFVLEYMDWLGHHEFGRNQKPFLFEESLTLSQTDKASLDYWLEIWINYYRQVLSLDHPNTLLINYDGYCRHPMETVQNILKKTGIKAEIPDLKPFVNTRKAGESYAAALYNEAQGIYKQLQLLQGDD